MPTLSHMLWFNNQAAMAAMMGMSKLIVSELEAAVK